ncbi:hypothetical protein Psfp_04123 [Pelotomaculum sp. FP]|uniref:YhbD family protein n=1 Tax=Pelotomaculum sp. FP TaxID=261474 RepID=UPI001066B897|nr:YhbD family protein [Pelotomaculum sp. FP]TEB10673.1 hypothetical protein Psfp_04123 [Pelotomaculum sp. FP]
MEQDLISKKELLDLTGISYGQLYRWKRKNLIPEDWFVKKSTFTGQETFFPKEKILARINKIMNMKEDLSLDALAGMFSPNPAEASLKKEELLKRNIVSNIVLDIFVKHHGDVEIFDFKQLLYVYVLEKMLQTGELSLEEGKILLSALTEHYPKFQGKNCDLIFVRKLGIATCLLISSPGEVHFESGAYVVFQLNLANCIEELKLKII